jgi:hypothetical protein
MFSRRGGRLKISRNLKRGKKMSKEETGKTEEDKLIEVATTKIRSERDAAMQEVDRLNAEVSNLKLANAKLRDHVESESKSSLIDEIRKISNHGIEYLSTCSVDRLEQILEDARMYKSPKFSSSGDLGGGYNDPYEKLHTMFKFKDRKR